MSANRLTMPSSTMNFTALFLGSSIRRACVASFIIVGSLCDMGHGAKRDDRQFGYFSIGLSALCYRAYLVLTDRISSAPSLFVEGRQRFFERRGVCQYGVAMAAISSRCACGKCDGGPPVASAFVAS